MSTSSAPDADVVVVVGATGALGKVIAARLIAAGKRSSGATIVRTTIGAN